MRWEDERYVRLYNRDTVEWQMWCWQARTVWPLILRKVDRAGLLELGRFGRAGLAKTLMIPLDHLEKGLDGTDEGPGLLDDGCIELRGTVLVVRNFVEAQEVPLSDAQRKRDQRERDRARIRESSQPIQTGHARSRGHEIGHSDPIRAEPCLADPSEPAHTDARVEQPAGGVNAEARGNGPPIPPAGVVVPIRPPPAVVHRDVTPANGPPRVDSRVLAEFGEQGNLTPDAQGVVMVLARAAEFGQLVQRAPVDVAVMSVRALQQHKRECWSDGLKDTAPTPAQILRHWEDIQPILLELLGVRQRPARASPTWQGKPIGMAEVEKPTQSGLMKL